MSIRNNERGQITVLTALCLVVLLGFVALAVDVGVLFRSKRNLQIVADAAATAGALDLYKTGSTTSAVAAAENGISSNGLSSAAYTTTCPNSGSGLQACVATPPSTGVHTGSGYVEVQITQPRSTVFMSMFGMSNLNVTTRAVAGIVTGQGCIWIKNNFNVQGNAGMCGISPSNPGAWTATNNPNCGSGTTCPANGFTTACGTYVGGNITGSGGGGGSNCIASEYVATPGSVGVNLNPSPAVSGAPSQTPPAWLTAAPPTPTNCSLPAGATSSVSHGVTIYTATISSGTVSGCIGWNSPPANTVLNLTLTNVTLDKSNIQFNLGSTVQGTGSNQITGGLLTLGSNVCNYCSGAPTFTNSYDGTTLELYSGSMSVSSTTTGINIYAPNQPTAASNGIALWEPSSNAGTIDLQWGSATSNFYGYIVAPGATLSMQDQGGSAVATGLYVNNLAINSQLGIMNYNSVVPGSPGHNIALVE